MDRGGLLMMDSGVNHLERRKEDLAAHQHPFLTSIHKIIYTFLTISGPGFLLWICPNVSFV